MITMLIAAAVPLLFQFGIIRFEIGALTLLAYGVITLASIDRKMRTIRPASPAELRERARGTDR